MAVWLKVSVLVFFVVEITTSTSLGVACGVAFELNAYLLGTHHLSFCKSMYYLLLLVVLSTKF